MNNLYLDMFLHSLPTGACGAAAGRQCVVAGVAAGHIPHPGAKTLPGGHACTALVTQGDTRALGRSLCSSDLVPVSHPETSNAEVSAIVQADTQAYQRMYKRFFSEDWRGEYPPDPSTGLLGARRLTSQTPDVCVVLMCT